MQPIPNSNNTGRVTNPRGPVVDPRPGNKAPRIKPVVDPRPVKKAAVKPLPVKKQTPIKVAPPSIDDKIYRTMPITQKDLGRIKKMYGI
jgi:hypothetical protein